MNNVQEIWLPGITKKNRGMDTNQETLNRIREFTEDRDLDLFHSPGDLAKSIVIEASYLIE